MRALALLRGVNVGGNNKISMAALKQVFLQHGFADVVTYINSGNILFTHESGDALALQETCRRLIQQHFALDIVLAVLPVEQLHDALAHAPDWWNADGEAKHNAIFVIPPATAEEVMAQVGDIRPEYERLAAHGPVIFWSAPLATFSRTRYSKVVGTPAYGSITIRNANTALKLAELGREEPR